MGAGRVGSGGSVGTNDVGADVGVGCVDGTVGAAVAAGEAAGTDLAGAAIVGLEVRAGAGLIDCDDAGAVGAAVPCGPCAGAADPDASGGCCDARTGAGERAGAKELRGGEAAGELRSAPDTSERAMSLGPMMRMPTMRPTVAPMMISRSCSLALKFASKDAASRLPDPTRCALRLPPMIGPVK